MTSPMMECASPGCERRVISGPLCPGCRTEVKAALAEWPVLYAHLQAGLPRSSGGGSERVSGTAPSSNPPVRESVLDVLDQVTRLVVTWARHVRIAAGIGPTRDGSGSNAFNRGCIIISARLPVALDTVEGGLRWGIALVELRTRARRQLGLTPLIHRLPAPCPSCDVKALVRHNGADTVTCAVCAASWPQESYDVLMNVLLQNSNGIPT